MAKKTVEGFEGAGAYLHERATLPTLKKAAEGCHGCPLHARATQVVMGEGPSSAPCMLVGEQPGNEEDLSGHPFVGPAGRVLEDALERAGLARTDVFTTNVVKHFSWEPRGKRRIHKTPAQREVDACRPWLEAEAKLVAPHVLVCLGATAARALVGPKARVTQMAKTVVETPWCARTIATIHPSSVLRERDSDARAAMLERLVGDLTLAAELLASR